MNKLTFWIIGDDISRKLLFNKFDNHIIDHCEIEITDITLTQALHLSRSVDIIILDLGAISEGPMISSNRIETHFDTLKRFAIDHSNSILMIISGVANWAGKAYKGIFKDLKNEITLEFGQNNVDDIAKYIAKKVLEYYPYENS